MQKINCADFDQFRGVSRKIDLRLSLVYIDVKLAMEKRRLRKRVDQPSDRLGASLFSGGEQFLKIYFHQAWHTHNVHLLRVDFLVHLCHLHQRRACTKVRKFHCLVRDYNNKARARE